MWVMLLESILLFTPPHFQAKNRVSRVFGGFAFLVILCGFSNAAWAQSLMLSSATATAGTTVVLNLSVSSPAGSAPAALEWTLTYPAASVASISVAAGAAPTAAGKSIACAGGAAAYTCIAYGLNSNTISNGVVAVVTATLTSSATTALIGVPSALGASLAGASVAVSTTGGTITIPSTAPVTVSSLFCSPTSVSSAGSSTCTVTLSSPAGTGGAAVTLSSSAASLTVPASVPVAAGSNSANFTATAGAITSTQTATLTAALNGSSIPATLTLTQPTNSNSNSNSSFTPIRVNAGGDAYTDPSGNVWSADYDYSGGATSLTSRTVTGTTTPVLYQTDRWGTFYYTVNAPNGNYTVNLKFAEIYFSTAGSRMFNVSINGTQVLTNFDIVAQAGGAFKALDESIPVTVTNGQINIQFTPGEADQPTVNAIEILNSVTTSFSTTAIKTRSKNGSDSPADLQSAALACNPAQVAAGETSTCEIRLGSGGASGALNLAVTSSAAHLRAPASVYVRTGQARARFEVTADADAPQGQATVMAQLGQNAVETALAVSPSNVPTWTAPAHQTGKPGSPVRFAARAAGVYNQPLTATASGLPPKASFDAASGDFEWLPTQGDLGTYRILFTATNSLGLTSTKTVTLDIESGLPKIAQLRNAAAGSAVAACTPGSMARLNGSFLTGDNGETHVLVNGESAAVVQALADRVDFLCPSVPAGTQLAIAVETPAGRSQPLPAVMQDVAPGILTAGSMAKNQALAFIGDSLRLAAVPNFEIAGQPAVAGDTLSVLVSGIGCNEDLTTRQPTLTLGTQFVAINSIEPAAEAAGICRISATVPAGVYGDSVPLTMQLLHNDGTPAASNTAFVAVGN